MQISLADAISKYGPIENNQWQDEARWCSVFTVPPLISQYCIVSATRTPLVHIYCNKDMQSALLSAFNNIIAWELENELRTFDGCFNIRSVRGHPGALSAHAYALAIDLNVSTNQLGTPGDMSIGMVDAFVSSGFTWGATFKRQDPQHFSFAWE